MQATREGAPSCYAIGIGFYEKSKPLIPMAEFEIFSPDREDIMIVDQVPAQYLDYRLTGATSFMAQCSFGDMLFYHHQGDGFDIWKSIYKIDRPATVIGRINRPVLELTSMYENSFAIDWKDLFAGKLPLKQIELYYSPYVDNTTQFRGDKQYLTMDVHFQPAMLEQYANQFPLLDLFLSKVQQNQPARLFSDTQFASPQMDGVLRDMMQYSYLDTLAPRYFDSYVNILLILLLERISGYTAGARVFSPADLAMAMEAKRLLTADYQASYTINRLCRQLGTNPYKLKTSFKHLYGISIGRYKKAAFMDYAKQLLLDTELSLDEISMLLGYNSQQSFTTAFRNHFGHTPGYLRRKGH
jgi:AraC-like DNA-binding protein